MKELIFFLVITLALVAGCSKGTEEEATGYGRIKVEAFDAPPPSDVEHIYLTITEVAVHSSDKGWVTLAEPNESYDFLELISGATAALADTTLEPGHYTQMRLVLADTNEVVVNGELHPLIVPSGEQTGIKLNLDLYVEEDEIVEVLVDFDASKSIIWTPNNYRLHPTFKAFKKVISGTVAGNVQDAAGEGIPNALVEAAVSNSTSSTVTDSSGAYKLILVEGTYDLKASAEDYTSADTTYTEVEVNAGDDLIGYDFILQQ